MRATTIGELVQLDFWQHDEGSGSLTVVPDNGSSGLAMPIRRVFVVTGVPDGGIRGDHAHRFCTQVVVCPHGRVLVKVDDGRNSTITVLNDPSRGLSIPPGLWNELTFEGPDTVVVVFCDKPYDPSDYIRDRREYEAFKGR